MRIRMVSVVTGAFLSLFSLVTAVQAADYYVSPTGKDSDSGTSPSQPWRTINKVNNRNFAAGDRIFFQGGQTFSGSLSFDSSDVGNLANPITIGSYGSGRAVIDAGLGRGFFAYNVAGYRIQNINFVGAGRTNNTTDGILFYTDLPGNVKLEFIGIDNVEVRGFGNHGVSIGADNNKSGFRSVQITYVDSHDNGQAGITVWGFFSSALSGYAHESVYIGYCKAYDNPGISGLAYNSGNGIVISDVNGGTIERSVAYNNGSLNTANGGPIGIWAWDANNITIQYNESHHNRTASATDGGGFDLDGGVTNSVMQYNYSHDNDGAGFLMAQFSGARPFSGNTLRYNISQNDGRKNGFAAIHLWNGGSGVKNSEIYNNTVYVSPAPSGAPVALYVQSPTTDIHVRNNLLVTTGGVRLLNAVSGQTGLLFQGNNYWSSGGNFVIGWSGSTYTSLSAWRAATGQERLGTTDVGLSVAPQLNNPGGGGTLNDADLLETLTVYQLQSTSPLINVGLNLFSLFGINNGGQDFYSIPVPQGAASDIGAHEAIGPLAAYGFNEGSGLTTADASGNGNTANLVGATWTAGKYGQGLAFNGTNQYVTGTDIDFPSGPFTLSGWFKTGVARRSKILSKYLSSTNQIYVLTGISGRINAGFYDGTTWQEVSPTQIYSDDVWHHFAMVVSPSTLELFVDGISKGTDSHDNSFPVNNVVWNMGRNSDNSDYFQGSLDEIKFYNKALTPAEVVNDMNTPLGAQDTTPPVISNGAPTGTLPAGTASTTMSVSTNENCTCKWGTVAGTSYTSLPNTFSTTGGTSHSTTVSGLSNGNTYTFYIRCRDVASNANASDYTVSFSVANPPPITGLLAAYGFNEGMGSTTADASGNGNTANLAGATWTAGKYGQGLAFNGTNQYVTGTDIDFPSGPFTLTGWFKTGVAKRSKILSKYLSSTNQIYVMTGISGRINAGLYDGTNWREVSPTQIYSDDVWHHFAMVVSASTIELFVDGVSKGTANHDNSFPVNNVVWNMGRNSNSADYFQGSLDEIRFYNKALTPAEVTSVMNTPL